VQLAACAAIPLTLAAPPCGALALLALAGLSLPACRSLPAQQPRPTLPVCVSELRRESIFELPLEFVQVCYIVIDYVVPLVG